MYSRITRRPTVPPGEAQGYLQKEGVKEGSAGSVVDIRRLKYADQTINGGQDNQTTVHPVSETTAYRSATGGGDPVTTTYQYSFFTGTVQIEEATTELPNVPDGSQPGSPNENGVNYPQNDTVKRLYDIQGRLAKLTDARGMETTYTYDEVTGAITQMVQDAASGGLQLTTDYDHDDLGRQTQSLGPPHDIDGQTVRTATWTVYQDEDNEIWTGQGYRRARRIR